MNRPSEERLRRILVALSFTAMTASAIAALYGFRPWQDGDSGAYLQLAHNLATGRYGRFVDGSWSPEASRPPGYPIFLWFILDLVGAPLMLVIALQLALYVVSIWLVSHLLKEWGRPAWPLLLLAVLYPFGLGYSAKVLTEGLATFLVTFAVYLLARPGLLSRRSAIAIGFLLGSLILVRANFILLPVVFLGCMAHRSLRHCNVSWFFHRSAALLLSLVITLSPYSLYDWRYFRTFSPLPRVGPGVGLYVASWQTELTADDFQSMVTDRPSDRVRRSGFADEVARINTQFGLLPSKSAPLLPYGAPPYAAEGFGSAHREILADALLRQLAIERIEAHPVAYLAQAVAGFWALWNATKYPPMPSFLRISLKTFSALVWIMGFLGGILLLVWRRSELMTAVMLPILYFPAIHIWLVITGRYTAPARPLLLLAASIVIVEVTHWFLQPQRAVVTGANIALASGMEENTTRASIKTVHNSGRS